MQIGLLGVRLCSASYIILAQAKFLLKLARLGGQFVDLSSVDNFFLFKFSVAALRILQTEVDLLKLQVFDVGFGLYLGELFSHAVDDIFKLLLALRFLVHHINL